MKKQQFKQELKNRLDKLELALNGGKGSGNFGHAGRPGKVGGSVPSGNGGNSRKIRVHEGSKEMDYFYAEDGNRILASGKTEKEALAKAKEKLDREQQLDRKIERAKDYAETSSDRSASWVEEADREAARDLGLEPDTMAPTKGEFWQEAIAILEARKDQQTTQSKEQKLAEIRDRNRQKREAEASKAKAEREEHIKQIDKIIGSEKITEGKTKAEDDKNYKKLEKDVLKIKRILSKEKSRENFGQDEIRKLKDKYSDYMSGNWSTVGRFMGLIRDLEDWADNYQNY